jgi:Nucleotidyltransferase of unknown function (DUF6036)
MKAEKDFEELFTLFNKHRVRYCIVGSYAVAFHARPRYTKDIDILIEASQKNSRSVLRALNEFGFKSLKLSDKDFRIGKRIIQLGYEPLRIDLLTGLEGCTFGRVWTNRCRGSFGKTRVNFIGLNDLIRLKRRSNRLQDKADLELLIELKTGQAAAKPLKSGSRHVGWP